MPAGANDNRVKILIVDKLTGSNSTENNVMTPVQVVDGVVFNQDELVTSMVGVKEYGAYVWGGKTIENVPTVEYAGETYVFGVYTLSSSAATTYRKGTATEFMRFMDGDSGPDAGGIYAFINNKNITG